jgi:hypothetical protein
VKPIAQIKLLHRKVIMQRIGTSHGRKRSEALKCHYEKQSRGQISRDALQRRKSLRHLPQIREDVPDSEKSNRRDHCGRELYAGANTRRESAGAHRQLQQQRSRSRRKEKMIDGTQFKNF